MVEKAEKVGFTKLLDDLRVIPRVMMMALIVMTWRVIEWFMTLPDPSPEQAALCSVMTGALTGAFAVFLGRGRQE
jgi:hypothetical protein